jgi:dTDP-4-dehydrorhamnose 3,5-epimerase
MIATPTPIQGLIVLEPTLFHDERGYFYESFNQTTFNAAIGSSQFTFVQDNHSQSKAGVLRGLHYQLPPYAQGKLVRVTQGRVWDVAVDLRKTSPTFGQWHGLELSAHNKKQFWIPPGFAHGFIALEDHTEFLYKTTAPYDKASEAAIVWNDPDLAIAWPQTAATLVNEKDAQASAFRQAKTF